MGYYQDVWGLSALADQFFKANEILNKAIKTFESGEPTEAAKLFSQAEIITQGWRATSLEKAGRYEEAADVLNKMEGHNGMSLQAIFRVNRFLGHPEHAITVGEQALEQFSLNPILLSDFAQLYDEVGEYKKAWDTASESNRKALDLHNDGKWLCGMEGFDELNWSYRTSEEYSPVFIAGMPRTGTTLLDRMLSCHPNLVSLGEDMSFMEKFNYDDKVYSWGESLANKPDVRFFIKKYIRQKRAISKYPFNFQWLGFIVGCFPKAKIIRMRRNRKDVAVSIYLRNFRDGNYGWSRHLDGIVDAIAKEEYFWDFWKSQGIEWKDVWYEDLIKQTDATIKSVYKFIGEEYAPWSGYKDKAKEIMEASYEEVRLPISDAHIERWRNYYEFAPGFFDELDQI